MIATLRTDEVRLGNDTLRLANRAELRAALDAALGLKGDDGQDRWVYGHAETGHWQVTTDRAEAEAFPCSLVRTKVTYAV
jgi:hypothetical protein